MATPTPPPVTPERIMQFAFGFAAPLMLEAALHHHIFDVLDDGPKSIAEVSAKTGASVRGLRAVMNALVGFAFLARTADGRYALTPESATFLVSTKPTFHGAIFKHTSTQLLPKWLQLTEIVRTGKPAMSVNQENEGGAFFEQFVEAIFPMSYAAAQRLAEHLQVAQATQPLRVLDLAAGSGVWGIALAERSPQVRVTAVDWPEVIPVTRRVAARHGLADRFSYVAGDLLTADFGRGHHVATLGHILHSEGEARSQKLLRKVGEALAPGGTIAIGEFVVNADRTGPPQSLVFAMNMLVNTEAGDTYSFADISGWLTAAGFTDARELPAPGPSPLILATKCA